MSKYKWKTYGASIQIPDSPLIKNIFELLEKRRREEMDCMMHYLEYKPLSNPYRKYRRGKNRCVRCGLKIKGDS